jgi:hypothetical protein
MLLYIKYRECSLVYPTRVEIPFRTRKCMPSGRIFLLFVALWLMQYSYTYTFKFITERRERLWYDLLLIQLYEGEEFCPPPLFVSSVLLSLFPCLKSHQVRKRCYDIGRNRVVYSYYRVLRLCIMACLLKTGISKSERTSVARQRLGQLNTFTRQRVQREWKPQQWNFRGNESANGRCIGIEEIEGFQKVSSSQSANNSLKGIADGN